MELFFESPDGVRTCGRLREAADVALRGRRIIVMAHGFSGSKDAPDVVRISEVFGDYADVLTLDMRGHGQSGGASSLAWLEPLDVAEAVSWARAKGYEHVSTAGFSMGAAVVLRHAAEYGDTDRVAAISGPAFWYYRGTKPMRWLHRAVANRPGRLILRFGWKARVSGQEWPEPWPMDPTAAAAALAPTPLLVVHGDRDRLFPVEHAQALMRSAQSVADSDATLWLESGFGHAERSTSDELARRIGAWLVQGGST